MADYKIEIDKKKRIEELAQRSNEQGIHTFTRFLTPPEIAYAIAAAKKKNVFTTLCSGLDQGERQIIGFSPNGEIALTNFPLGKVEIIYKGKPPKPLGHRDVLGAVLALRIDRSYIGDILLSKDKALVIVMKQSIPLLVETLGKVGTTWAKVKEVDEEVVFEQEVQKNEIKITVASLRLDGVLAAATRKTRDTVSSYIERGLVKVNHLPVSKKDKNILLEDIISLRGYGRLEIVHIGSPNRKKRIPVTLWFYGISHYA